MGRKAKLKQTRKESKKQPQNQIENNPNKFVDQLQRQGYQFNNIQHSPELPEDKPEPQV